MTLRVEPYEDRRSNVHARVDEVVIVLGEIWDRLTALETGDPQDFDLNRIKMRAVKRALGATGGNKMQAAHLLGISTKTLYNMIANEQ